jgi:hypothetical protein
MGSAVVTALRLGRRGALARPFPARFATGRRSVWTALAGFTTKPFRRRSITPNFRRWRSITAGAGLGATGTARLRSRRRSVTPNFRRGRARGRRRLIGTRRIVLSDESRRGGKQAAEGQQTGGFHGRLQVGLL